ncbi:MAG: protein-glutamate O-methyltransferase CheR [Deltaproteobacteria bacterium]|nr:protein-glutamate O-methyltransferase CheR [Deltaproteobacteria bacterium]
MSLLRADFDFVRELVLKRTSIVLDDRQAYLAESRLLPVARKFNLKDLSDLVTQCRLHPDGAEALASVEAMTTNETSFFRDVHPFEALKHHVIPALIAARSSERRINIWCAACSTGQEPYSIAMLVREHFPQLASWQIDIMATDVATSILDRAREGVFNQVEIGRGLPAQLMVKHFERTTDGWRAKDYLRNAISWRQLNLVAPWSGLPSLDIVFLRNVLIYFSTATRRLIMDRLVAHVRPDGVVFLGASESLIGVTDTFTSVTVGRSIAYKLAGRS